MFNCHQLKTSINRVNLWTFKHLQLFCPFKFFSGFTPIESLENLEWHQHRETANAFKCWSFATEVTKRSHQYERKARSFFFHLFLPVQSVTKPKIGNSHKFYNFIGFNHSSFQQKCSIICKFAFKLMDMNRKYKICYKMLKKYLTTSFCH